MGAGAARTIAPDRLPRLAIVTVDIARIGAVEAMVDSGAMVSVVRIDVVRKLLREENRVEGFIVGFDKTRVRVVGEMELTVRFKCQVANLRRVKVVESSVYEMILGAEWIAKSNIVICAAEGRLVARVRTSVIDAALHAPQKEIEEQKY